MKANHRGVVWEQAAEQFLCEKGLSLVCRNFHCRLGEIDLIMRESQTIVFVEVRYRGRRDFGSALESVTVQKQLKICRAAGIFLSRKPHLAMRPCRFDIVALSENTGTMQIDWVQNAFESTLH